MHSASAILVQRSFAHTKIFIELCDHELCWLKVPSTTSSSSLHHPAIRKHYLFVGDPYKRSVRSTLAKPAAKHPMFMIVEVGHEALGVGLRMQEQRNTARFEELRRHAQHQGIQDRRVRTNIYGVWSSTMGGWNRCHQSHHQSTQQGILSCNYGLCLDKGIAMRLASNHGKTQHSPPQTFIQRFIIQQQVLSLGAQANKSSYHS